MVNKMSESVDRLTKLLDTLLNWALQQRGHFPYVPERIGLDDLMEDVIDMFRDTAVSKNIKLEYAKEETHQLLVDRNTASTILRNLVNNAIKFTRFGGHVKISSSKDESGKFCKITVIDNGVGMDQDKIEGLFNLDETKSTKGTSGETGLGLGLQLVYEFVQLNKGKLEVKSKPDEGTTFTVYLPLTTDLTSG